MKHPLFLAVVFLGLIPCESGALAPGEHEGAITVLFDPHAASNAKLAAIRRLENEADEANSSQRVQAISALVRQAHFDMEAVREAASDVLDRYVGHWEAQLLIKQYVVEDFDAFVGQSTQMGDNGEADLLRPQVGPFSLGNQRAIQSFGALAATDVRRVWLLDEPQKARLAAQLERSVAAAELFTTPKSQAIANDAIFKSIKAGKPISPAVLKLHKPDSESLTSLLLESAKAGSSAVVRSTALALVVTGIQGEAAKSELERLLRDRDADVRRSAALLLDTPQAHDRVRVPDLLERIKTGSVVDRQVAARQLNELAIEPAPVTAALVHAVDNGDFAARQGLVAALEAANYSNRDPLEVLKQASDENESSTPRAYARAALRQLDLTKAQREVKP